MRAHLWAALVATGMVIAVPLSAGASSDMLRTPDGAPMAFERLAPGMGGSNEVIVTNPSDGPATIALEMRIADDHENGCLRQELAIEADSCDDTGELGDWLDVTISRDGQQLWTGPIKDLGERQQLAGSLAAGGSWDLEIGIEMPFEAGNDTMSDRIDFDLIAHAATDTGEKTDVLGIQGSAPGAEGVDTGVDVPIAVDAGMELLELGTSTEAETERLITYGSLGLVLILVIGLLVVERRRNRH